MRRRALLPLPVVLVGMVIGCTGGEMDEAGEGTSVQDTIAMAAAQYDPTIFDTLTWESPDAALARGAVVFSYSCEKCHGPKGFGDGGFVLQGDTLHPPSFHKEDWFFAENPDSLRKKIFVGAEIGMPHWGLEGLKYRDIDAVARHILETLR